MKIALVGYGKMGKAVERYALAAGHHISARLNTATSLHPLTSETDVAIDFSTPDALPITLNILAEKHIPVVIGTTGWDLALATKPAQEIGIFYSPNFSIGISILTALLRRLAILASEYGFVVTGDEIHHCEKRDSPSGTALLLAESVPTLTFKSMRLKNHPSSHQVTFQAPHESLTFSHKAHSRDAYLPHILSIAAWLIEKKGFFQMDDYLKESELWKGLIQH